LSTGLASILLEKSPLLKPTEEELFARMAHFARGGKVQKFGTGGDVEGGKDDSVGGSPAGGSFSDPGGWGTDSIDSSVADAINNGDWAGGDSSPSASFDNFGNWQDNGQTSPVSYDSPNDYYGGYNINDVTMPQSGYDAVQEGMDNFSGAEDFNGYRDADFSSSLAGLSGLSGLSGSFAPTESGYPEQDAPMTVGQTPLAGDMADFAPGPLGALSAGLNPGTLSGLGALTAMAQQDPLQDDGYIDAANVAPPLPDVGPMPPANPVTAMSRMAATENMQNYSRFGDKTLQGPMEVALNRAATNHLGYGTDVYDQIMAPSQFSGMNRRGEINTSAIKQADSFLAEHPEVYGIAADLLTGERPGTMTKGAINLDGPDKYSRTGKDYVDLGGQRAWSPDDTALQSAQVLAGVLPDSAPVPPAAPGRIETAVQPDDEPAVGYGIVGPQSMLSPISDKPAQSWGDYLGSMLSMSAQAKPLEGRVPDLPNQPAYGPQFTSPSVLDESGMGPLNGTPVAASKPGVMDSITGALTGLFGSDKAAAKPSIDPSRFDPVMASGMRAPLSEYSFADYSKPTVTAERHPADSNIRGALAMARDFNSPAFDAMVAASQPSQLGPGVQVAGSGVVPAGDKPSASTGPQPGTTASKGTSPARGTTTADVYGPTMPGMLPGTLTYPEEGVISQPSTKFHETIAERAAPAALGMGIPGLSLASMASGLFGGPTMSGLFSNSAPGLNLTNGSPRVGGEGERDSRSADGSKAPKSETKSEPKPQKTASAPFRTTAGDRYLGPAKDPKTYGYGAERRYFG
jgi:hypothetical protein